MPSKKETTWTAGIQKKQYSSLRGRKTTDVAIIGGGLAGVLSAYLFAKAGKKVILLEGKRLGHDATGKTTGFLTQSLDTDPSRLIRVWGKARAEALTDSHGKAIAFIKRVVKEEKIECELLRCSNIVYAHTNKEAKALRKEIFPMRKLGLQARWRDGKNMGFKNAGMIEIENQAKFHPLKFLFGVASSAEKCGARIFEDSLVKEVEKKGKSYRLKTSRGEVRATWVIAATYAPFKNPKKLFFKKGMYTSYVFELKIPKGKIPEGTYEDTRNPYAYFRVDSGSDFDRVIVGGEDHRSDIPVSERKSFAALESFVNKTFGRKSYAVKRRWKGPILEPVDGIAFIGALEDDPRMLYATGFSGNGMTYSVIAARIFHDTILHKRNPLKKIYDADRALSLKALLAKGRDFAGEFFGGAVKNTLRKRYAHPQKKKYV